LHLKGQLKLEAEGVPVAIFAPHDFAGLFSTIQRLGGLTGREEAAASLNRTRAGGVNVVETATRLAPFSLEALLQADPDVYVI